MRRMGWVMLAVVGLVSVGGLRVMAIGEHEMPTIKPRSEAFERIKGLVGRWEGTTREVGSESDKSAVVEYQLTAGGTAVIETLFPGTEMEMVSVYDDEQEQLVMTHYCTLGNQPKMELTDVGAQHLSLDFAGGQGIDPASDMHMHSLTIAWDGPDQVTQTWTAQAEGSAMDPTVMTLSRVR